MPERPRLLIVDDDRRIAQAVAMRLKAAGYDVQSAHDGEAGLAAATEQLPDLVVLDIRMPKIDGLSVLARLREQEQTRHIQVIVLSACAVDECRALDAGAFCFLPKPYDPQTLLDSISAALNSDIPVGTQAG